MFLGRTDQFGSDLVCLFFSPKCSCLCLGPVCAFAARHSSRMTHPEVRQPFESVSKYFLGDSQFFPHRNVLSRGFFFRLKATCCGIFKVHFIYCLHYFPMKMQTCLITAHILPDGQAAYRLPSQCHTASFQSCVFFRIIVGVISNCISESR